MPLIGSIIGFLVIRLCCDWVSKMSKRFHYSSLVFLCFLIQEHLSPANHPVPLTTVTAAATPLLPIATPLSTLTSLHSAPHPPPILTTLQPVQSLQLQQEEINKKKLKKKKKEEEEFQQTHHILTHHHHPPPTPEGKMRLFMSPVFKA